MYVCLIIRHHQQQQYRLPKEYELDREINMGFRSKIFILFFSGKLKTQSRIGQLKIIFFGKCSKKWCDVTWRTQLDVSFNVQTIAIDRIRENLNNFLSLRNVVKMKAEQLNVLTEIFLYSPPPEAAGAAGKLSCPFN